MPLELLIGAAVGAGLASPGTRKVLRKGAVFGLAGALMAYDRVSEVAASFKSSKKEATATEAPKKAASEGTCEGSPAANPTAPTEPASTA